MSNVSAPSPAGGVSAPRQDDQAADTKRIPNNKGIDAGLVRTTGPIGDITVDYEQFLAFMRGENPERPASNGTERLTQLLANGGSTQIQALRAYNHAMNVTIALERFAEQGVQPTEAQAQEAVALLNEQSDWEILQSLSAAEAAGTLGKSDVAAGVIYDGIDLSGIEFTEAALSGAIPLMPEDLASLTDAECTQAVEALLGSAGGGPELSAKREALRSDPAALAQFDRGLLATLGSTLMAAYNDPEYAKQLGIEFPTEEEVATQEEAGGGIPEKYQGDILMMLAYVFAKRDQELTNKVKACATKYNESIGKQQDAKEGDPALESSISYQELQLKTSMSMLEKNSAMGASLIDGIGNSKKRIWS